MRLGPWLLVIYILVYANIVVLAGREAYLCYKRGQIVSKAAGIITRLAIVFAAICYDKFALIIANVVFGYTLKPVYTVEFVILNLSGLVVLSLAMIYFSVYFKKD